MILVTPRYETQSIGDSKRLALHMGSHVPPPARSTRLRLGAQEAPLDQLQCPGGVRERPRR